MKRTSQNCPRILPINFSVALFGAILFSASPGFGQGTLTPPGPPAATMKTLDQLDAKLEKRTPISKLPYTINLPGSYYLTANLGSSSDGNAITISVDNVSLDLNGFTLTGSAVSANGILVAPSVRHIRVHNGAVRGFGSSGVNLANATGTEIYSLLVRANGSAGINGGDLAIIHDCVSRDNGGNNFQTLTSATITHCVAASSADASGFSVGPNSSLTDCVSYSNLQGYTTGDGCSLHHCVAYQNKDYGIFGADSVMVVDCTVSKQSSGFGIGIRIANDGTVNGCTSSKNEGDGIQMISNCAITNNTASENGKNTSGVGIHGFGAHNRIDSNTAVRNKSYGIQSFANDANGDFITRNLVHFNTGVAGPNSNTDVLWANINKLGPFQSPDNATSPWANFR